MHMANNLIAQMVLIKILDKRKLNVHSKGKISSTEFKKPTK